MFDRLQESASIIMAEVPEDVVSLLSEHEDFIDEPAPKKRKEAGICFFFLVIRRTRAKLLLLLLLVKFVGQFYHEETLISIIVLGLQTWSDMWRRNIQLTMQQEWPGLLQRRKNKQKSHQLLLHPPQLWTSGLTLRTLKSIASNAIN